MKLEKFFTFSISNFKDLAVNESFSFGLAHGRVGMGFIACDAIVVEFDLGKGRGDKVCLPFTTTNCNYGGTRRWFLCISCGRRAGLIYYFNSSRLVCRLCIERKYSSQSLRKSDRLRLKRLKLQTKYPTLGTTAEKPKGLHKATWDDILQKYRRLDEAIPDEPC